MLSQLIQWRKLQRRVHSVAQLVLAGGHVRAHVLRRYTWTMLYSCSLSVGQRFLE